MIIYSISKECCNETNKLFLFHEMETYFATRNKHNHFYEIFSLHLTLLLYL